MSLTRGEIDLLLALCGIAKAAGTELDVYEALDEEEKATWLDRLESASTKLGAASTTRRRSR